jgi:hypothetical protein
MKPDPLDRLLADFSAQPPPHASGLTHAEVWQAIELRRGQSVWARMLSLLEWRELFSEPRMAVAGAAFAIIVGVVPAAVVGRAEDHRRLARQSIHFDVFSAESVSLGSVFSKPLAVAPALHQ